MTPAARPRRVKRRVIRAFWLAAIVVALVLGAGLLAAATWRGFDPRRVSVHGNRTVPEAEIRERANISLDANLWLQNMGAASRRVEAIPSIDRAWIHRTFPATVTIVVTERTPFAIVHYGNGFATVDRALRVLDDAPSAAGLPEFDVPSVPRAQVGAFLTNADVVRLRDDYDTLSAAHVAIQRLAFDKFGDVTGVTAGGVGLFLGDDGDLAQKSRLIAPILSQVAASGRRVKAIDLRAVKTPVVVYR